MEAIILAGGFGTRLAKVVKDVPKPMAPVAGRPFLQFVIDDLIEQGVDRIILAVCYKKDVIIDFFGSYYRGAEILYSIETTPLLTGGAVRQALRSCKEDRVFIINGDTFFSVDLNAMRRFSVNHGKNVVIAVKEMREFSRYGKVEIDAQMEVVAFHEKQYCDLGFINGGIYDLKRTALDVYPSKFSMEDEYFPVALKTHDILAFPSQGLFIDIGIPEDYQKAQALFKIPLRRAAFFDRDGTINVNYGHVYKPEDLEFVPGTPEIIHAWNKLNVPVIVISNQAGIAKGLYTETQMNTFNEHLNNRLKQDYDAHIDAFYICPHHPDYTGECDCRKPKPGLILKAAKEWDIDLSKSIFYGDKESDHLAAEAAGVGQFCLIRCEDNV